MSPTHPTTNPHSCERSLLALAAAPGSIITVSLLIISACSRTPYCQHYPERDECARASDSTSDDDGNSATSGADAPTEADATSDGETTDATTTAADEESTGGEPLKWDIGSPPDGGYFACGQPGHTLPSSSTTGVIWIPIPSTSRVMKYDVETLVPLSSYYTQPNEDGQPSLVSVSLGGNPIVISRAGEGITKFLSNTSECEDRNGIEGIQTSVISVPLPWDMEECRAWHKPLADLGYTLSVATWAPGAVYGEDCSWFDEKIWLTGNHSPGVEVSLLDGEDGTTLHTIDIFSLGLTSINSGASDADGNFWGVTNTRLVRVDQINFVAQVWTIPQGFPSQFVTVGPDGSIWTCGRGHVARFDPLTEEWQSTAEPTNYADGCAFSDDGVIYVRHESQVTAFKAISMDTLETVDIFDTQQLWYGLTVDFAGRVWLTGSSPVLRVTPTHPGWTMDSFPLAGTTQYSSDLTGHALHAIY